MTLDTLGNPVRVQPSVRVRCGGGVNSTESLMVYSYAAWVPSGETLWRDRHARIESSLLSNLFAFPRATCAGLILRVLPPPAEPPLNLDIQRERLRRKLVMPIF